MADLSAPLVENQSATTNAILPARSISRTRLFFALAVLDIGVVTALSLRAYSWEWRDLVSGDLKSCGISKSILDLAISSLARCFAISLLLTTNYHSFVFRASYVTMLCALSAVYGLVKMQFIASHNTSEQCAGDVQRERTFVIATACEQAAMAVMQTGVVNLLAKHVRQRQARDLAIREASMSHGSDLDEPEGSPDASTPPREGARSNTKALLARARPEIKWLAAGCIVLCIRLPFSLALPHFVSETIGALLHKDAGAVRFNITAFIVCGILDALFDFWCVFLFGYTQQRIIRSLRQDLFRNLLQQEVSYYDTTSTGNISSRLTSDTAEMANDLTWVFRFTIEAVYRIVGIGGYMFYRNWKMASLACCIIPVIAAINRKYGVWMSENANQVQGALADANSVAQEVISAMKTVFSFATELQEYKRYDECVQRHYQLNVRQTIISGVYYMVVSTFLTNMGVQAALLIYGSTLVFDGSMNTQTLLAFMLYQGQLQEYFRNLFNSFTNLVKSAGAGAKVFELLERKCQVKRSGTLKLTNVEGRVKFENVRFCYASRDQERPALDDVSFQALRGEVVAFVGPSGGGKSTIFNLIEHFYEPVSGRVCLDDVNVWEFDHQWLHQVIALVGQEPVLFSGSIESNIRYSRQSATHEQVVEAATIANAHAFVSQLPEGYETGVGERGLQLSGGQKQRVAIARAILQDPAVLLLDEATSALDSESEALVQEALEKAMSGRTTLVIAHRLSTVSRADRIVFILQGRILETGTHHDLLAKPLPAQGELSYRALIEKQARALTAQQQIE